MSREWDGVSAIRGRAFLFFVLSSALVGEFDLNKVQRHTCTLTAHKKLYWN